MLSRTKSVDSFIFIFFFLPPPLSLYLKFHFGTTTAPLSTPPYKTWLLQKDWGSMVSTSCWLAQLLSPLSHLSIWYFRSSARLQEAATSDHLLCCTTPFLYVLLPPLFFLSDICSTILLQKKKKKLNQITLFCTYSDILPFLLKASIF